MKGVSTIIATILLVLVVIAIIAAVAVNFQSLVSGTSQQADEATQEVTGTLSKTIRIESAADTLAVLRNTGSVAIPVASLAFFINNALVACDFGDVTSLASGDIKACTLASPCTDTVLKVTAPGNTATISCV